MPVASDWMDVFGRPDGWIAVQVFPPSLLDAMSSGPTGAWRACPTRVIALESEPSLPPAATMSFPDRTTLVALKAFGPTGAQLLPPSSER